MTESNIERFELKISLHVLEELGVKLYNSLPAVLSELVANSWDAGAKTVSIETDGNQKTVTVVDDGIGMYPEEIQEKYLTVGYRRRDTEEGRQTPITNRLPMGRKGIGKLSVFAIAKDVEVHSARRDSVSGKLQKTTIIMNLAEIEEAAKKEKPYHPKKSNNCSRSDPGTTLVLREVEDRFYNRPLRKRLARRFAVIGPDTEFNVIVDGTPVNDNDRDYLKKLEMVWWFDGKTKEYLQKRCPQFEKLVVASSFDNEIKVNGDKYKLNGWIGLVAKRSDLIGDHEADSANRVVLMVRNRLAHEDLVQIVNHGGIFERYLVGELHADFLDIDDKPDTAVAGRQSIQEEDLRFREIVTKLRKVFTSIGTVRGVKKQEQALSEAEKIESIKEWLNHLTSEQRQLAKKLFKKIGSLDIPKNQRPIFYSQTVLVFENLLHRDLLNNLETLKGDDLQRFSEIFNSYDNLEAVLYYKAVQERLGIIKTLKNQTDKNSKERIIQEHLYKNLWLFDPSWDRATERTRMENSVRSILKSLIWGSENNEVIEANRDRIDIFYREISGTPIVIELKKPKPSKKLKTINLVNQIDQYKSPIQAALIKQNQSNRVDVVCLLGELPEDLTTSETAEDKTRLLESQRIKIMTYEDVIFRAENMYSEFLDAQRKVQEIIKIIDKIERELSSNLETATSEKE